MRGKNGVKNKNIPDWTFGTLLKRDPFVTVCGDGDYYLFCRGSGEDGKKHTKKRFGEERARVR